MAEGQIISHDKATRSSPWGLRLIGDTTSEIGPRGVAVDIVAVHGLGANPDHAWVRHKDMSEGLEKDVRWLTDLLPQTFRDYKISLCARIFCFNYQSAWLGPQLSRNRLESLAVRLLDEIHNVRDKDEPASDRPLIFIGHSFGGLVIEQAIVQANSAGGRYEYLVRLIGGVVLLGIPHQGSKSQKWGSIVANLANLIDYGETELMKEVDEKSMKIFDLISDFKKIMISMDLAKTAVICFYENLKTNYLARVFKSGQWIQRQTSFMVVEERSAVLPGFYSIPLDSDHLKLNKFPSAQDGNYVSVSSNLCRIAAEAPNLIRRRRKEEPLFNLDNYFLVSRQRVKDFIPRDDLLDKIRSHFSGDQIGSPSNLILYALGGQGKSQIVLEYCRKWRDTYRGVFWIDANSKATVTQSYGIIAAELFGGSQTETGDSAVQIKMVKGHLERWSEPWLLLFDNYDEPEKFPEIKDFIPIKGCGHVIFTSRNRDLDRLGTLLEIPPMKTEEGVMLLLCRYNSIDIQPQHRIAASRIVERLGGLALAIDQAAAYIKYKRILLDRLEDFLTTYEVERQKILSYTPKNFWEYEHINAFTTWELSFQQLGSGDDQWKENAAHFLTLSAFFAPTSITESIFRCYQENDDCEVAWIKIFTKNDRIRDDRDEEDDQGDSQVSGRGFHATWDPDHFWDVIAKSDELSLLQSISQGKAQEGANYSLHPLIRDWLQLRLKAKERAKYTYEAISVLRCCANTYDARSTTLEEKIALIKHMDVSLSNEAEFSEPQDRLSYQFANCNIAGPFASYYYKRGRYCTSENLLRRVLEAQGGELNENHPDALVIMCNLAAVLFGQGKYKESESMHRRTLTLGETFPGKNNPYRLTSMTNLASVLKHQGKYEEAERISRETLILQRTVLGSENSNTLNNMTNLASILQHQGKYEEAERINRETMILQETVLGSKHPDRLASMNNLAVVLQRQGKYEEAERICRETLILKETVLGKEHPDTLACMNNLALTLADQKKHKEAEPIHRKDLMLCETVLGKEHPLTLTSMTNLASTLAAQDKHEEAERIIREALILSETVKGKEHPDTLISMNNLGMILYNQKKYEEGERIFQQILIIRETVSGIEHIDTLQTRAFFAVLLHRRGKHEEAERICRQTLILRENVLGKEHPHTLRSMNQLGRIWYDQQKYEEAEHICRQTLILREKVLGKEHSDALESREYLAEILRSEGKHKEAEFIAAVGVAEQKEANTAAYLPDGPASPETAAV